ncbi:MAG TPA: APC family permease [Acidimicrobiales bacterium]|jgi:amino acid transporter
MPSALKRVLVGRPLASAEEAHQRLPKSVALPVFASDAISSTAYATEEILLVLVPAAGLTIALSKLVPIAIVVVILLVIVVTSYRQTLYAYPNGGGSYIVSRENLGELPSLVAGASLLVDYILTVAVSISAGVAAILSAAQNDTLFKLRVPICLLCVLVMMLANLRGLKESGRIFAGPTYVYIVALGLLLVSGLYQSLSGHLQPLPPNPARIQELTGGTATGLTVLILLRAFSSGAIALSGVEAISNGVPAFRKPESRNAARTLTIMGVILGTYFFGIAVLAHHLAPTPSENETLLSVMARAVFGGGTPLYLILQISTFAILVLAANTAYADFPRLSSIIARDGYLPRQLANRGDRLVFSNGILVLSGAAAVLIIGFGGQTSLLIQLYAVGVFTGFTLSQAGMVVHHWRLREPRWKVGLGINATGAFATGLVMIIVLVSKFTKGAWIPAALIPLIVLFFKSIKNHYDQVEAALSVDGEYRQPRHTHTIVVLVGRVHRATLAALTYAKSLAPDRLVAMSVVTGPEEAAEIHEQWVEHHLDIPLEIKLSPYRDLTGSVVEFIDELDRAHSNDIVTVILPEFVLNRWWQQLLHNQSALMLKGRLLFRRNTVVVSVPYHIEDGKAEVLGDPDPVADKN